LIKHLLLKRSGFGMSVKDSLHPFNVRVTGLANEIMPPGRAYFTQNNTLRVVQTALVENAALYVNRINEQIWGQAQPAHWRQNLEQLSATEGSDAPASNPASPLDIDTAGLLQDLLGERSDE